MMRCLCLFSNSPQESFVYEMKLNPERGWNMRGLKVSSFNAKGTSDRRMLKETVDGAAGGGDADEKTRPISAEVALESE